LLQRIRCKAASYTPAAECGKVEPQAAEFNRTSLYARSKDALENHTEALDFVAPPIPGH
jgi:hypothetical protein